MEKIKNLFGAQDMSIGKPDLVILKFAIPLLIGNIVQQLYSTVDAIIVGKYVGDSALAAVGAANPLMFLLLCLFMGIATGAGIIVAQYFGAKNRETLSKSIGNIITATFVTSLFITIVGLFATMPLLRFLNTPEEIIMDAAWYLWILLIGFAACGYYNMISGILRGMGDSIMPLLYLIITCVLNIVLDIVFVAIFNLGVPGVAIATALSQFVSSVLCLIRLRQMSDIFDFKLKYLKPHKEIIMQIIKIGTPAGLTHAIFACASLIIQSLTNSFGTMVIATSTVIMRVDGFAMLPNFTFSTAMTTYVGQNIGANNMQRVHESTRHGIKLALIFSIPIVLILSIFGGLLMDVFTDTPEVVDLGMKMLRVMSVGYIAVAITQVLLGVMRGAGDTFTPMITSVLSTVVFRMPLAYLMAYLTISEEQPNGAPESIFYSLMISWVLGALITAIAYKRGKWKTKVKIV